jgi:hypothetical protein
MAKTKNKQLPKCDICNREHERMYPVWGEKHIYMPDKKQCFDCLANRTEESKQFKKR